MTYSQTELAKFKRFGDVTPNGVVFDWWLASRNGAGFCLLREPHHTDDDIEKAKRHIETDRDVVGKIGVAEAQP